MINTRTKIINLLIQILELEKSIFTNPLRRRYLYPPLIEKYKTLFRLVKRMYGMKNDG